MKEEVKGLKAKVKRAKLFCTNSKLTYETTERREFKAHC
jgi:hypothetical protein